MAKEVRFPCRPTGEAIDVKAAFERIMARYPKTLARLHEHEKREGLGG